MVVCVCSSIAFHSQGCGDDGLDIDDPAMEALCDRLIECKHMASSEKDSCVVYLHNLYTMYVVDPDTTAACFAQAACQLLEDQQEMEDLRTTCFDLDMKSFQCLNTDKLEFCNNQGTCKEISCRSACQQSTGKNSGDCGKISTQNHEGCRCNG